MHVSTLIKRLEDSRRGIPFERDVLAYGGMSGRRLLRVEQDGAELFLVFEGDEEPGDLDASLYPSLSEAEQHLALAFRLASPAVRQQVGQLLGYPYLA